MAINCLQLCPAADLWHSGKLSSHCTQPPGMAMQADVSRLHTLTRLEAGFISTPLQRPFLDDLFAGLPALRDVQLRFKTFDDEEPDEDDDDGGGSDAEVDIEAHHAPRCITSPQEISRTLFPDDLPQSLLRWVLPAPSVERASQPVIHVCLGCTGCNLHIQLLGGSSCCSMASFLRLQVHPLDQPGLQHVGTHVL